MYLFLIAVAVGGFWMHRRIRAERDIPELMRILISRGEPQMRCAYRTTTNGFTSLSRGCDRLFLDSSLDVNNTKERLFRAAKLAAKQGLVELEYRKAMIGGDYYVKISKEFMYGKDQQVA